MGMVVLVLLLVVMRMVSVGWVIEAVLVILRVMAQYRACPGIRKGTVRKADWGQDR